MKTVILCGGFGTRIRDVSENIPKPMIQIGNHPILWHIMKYYAHYGFNDFVLCLGYKSEIIKDYFINYEMRTSDISLILGEKSSISLCKKHLEEGWKITLAETGLEAMTGARIKRIESYLGNDKYFLLTYGDGVGDINIDDLIMYHHSHGKMVTVTGVRPPGRFGELSLSEDNTVLGFNEKPQVSGGLISGGFFVCNRELLEMLNDDEGLIFEQGPMKDLVNMGELKVYEHKGFWQPMDTSREYNL